MTKEKEKKDAKKWQHHTWPTPLGPARLVSRSSFQKVWKSMCLILQILQVYWLYPVPSRLLDSPTKSYFSFNSALSKRAILSRSVCSCAESTVESERKE
jgi:hypothetical protein